MKITRNKQIKGNFKVWQNAYAGTSNYYYPCDIYDAYKSPSCYKISAFRRCESLMKDVNGYGLVILGHNCMAFSVGFIGYINGLKHFFYITKDYDRALPLETMDRETGEIVAASL